MSTRSIQSGGESRSGPGPRARVVVGHHPELVDGPAEARPVLCPGCVPTAGLPELGHDVDGDEAAVVVEPPGQLLDERRERVAVRGLEGLPVHVHAGQPVGLAPLGDGGRVPPSAPLRREDRRRDGPLERVGGLVVVGERDEDTAVPAPGLGDEPGVEPGRDDAAVGSRLQPVHAHLVEGAGLDGRLQRGAVSEGPRADEVGAVRAIVVERGGQRERSRHGDDAGDDDDREGGEPPGSAPAAARAGLRGPVGVRGHASMMKAGRPRRNRTGRTPSPACADYATARHG